MKINKLLFRQNIIAFLPAVILCCILALLFSINVCMQYAEIEIPRVFKAAMIWCGEACVIEMWLAFLRPGSSPRKSHSLTIILHAFPLLDAMWFLLSGGFAEDIVFGHVALMATMIIAIPFVGFLHEKTDIRQQAFTLRWLGNIIPSAFIFGIAWLLIMALMAGVVLLFDLDQNLWANVVFPASAFWVLAIGWVTCVIGMVPASEEQVRKGRVVARVFLAILLLYMAALYWYLLKIIFSWQLPNGTVTWVVSTMMGVLVLVWALYYPYIQSNDIKGKVGLLIRFLPLLALPLIILMSVGVARRIADYGITYNRLYVLTANIWFYLVVGMMMLLTKKSKPISWIVLSFCCILVATSLIPGVNYYSLAHRILNKQLNTLIAQVEETTWPKSYTELQDWVDSLPEEQGEPIADKMYYLLYTYDYQGCTEWVSPVSEEDVSWGRHITYSKRQTASSETTIFCEENVSVEERSAAYSIPEGQWSQVARSSISTTCKKQTDEEGRLLIDVAYGKQTDRLILDLKTPHRLLDGYIAVPTEKGNVLVFRSLVIVDISADSKEEDMIRVNYTNFMAFIQ